MVPQSSGELLIPPDLTKGDISKRAFTTAVVRGYLPCEDDSDAIRLKVHGDRATVTVNRDPLISQPPGWLEKWAVQLEQQRCLAPGEGMKIAQRVVESVPLESRAALNLLYSNELRTGQVDIAAYGRLRVVNPIWYQPGVGLMAEGPYTVTGHDYTLNVTGRSTDNLAGYETTVYSITRKTNQIGYAIALLYTDRHINGRTERVARPTADYVHFPPSAAFYRLFYKATDNDFTELLVAARTPEELERNIATLQKHGASASCEMIEDNMCIPIRKDIGITSLVAVTVNGNEVLVSRGATVGNALASANVVEPSKRWPTLKVFKPWNNRLVPVAFRDDSILRLALGGGEIIRSR